jgi:hypothetical protein
MLNGSRNGSWRGSGWHGNTWHNGFNNRFHNGFHHGFGCWNCGFRWGWGWGWRWWWNPWWWGPGWSWWWPSWGWSWGWNDSSGNWSNSGSTDNSRNAYNNSSNYDLGDSTNVANANSQYPTTSDEEGTPNANALSANVAASRPTVLIYQKDGTIYAASDYWISGGKLHYVVNYGGEGEIELDQVDLQRTVDENAKFGVQFVLKPNPSIYSDTAK